MTYPKLYLAIDNCFGSKRFTCPEDWGRIVHNSGIRYVEGSADTECDMLYSTKDYIRAWGEQVKQLEEKYDIRLGTVYTGHGTYSTLGLTHTDPGCRERMLTEWLYPHVENAARFGAVAGFFCHAFDDSVVQDPAKYAEYTDILFSQMTKIALYAQKYGVLPCLEQMYSPQQFPWRVKDALRILKAVGRTAPFYITVDTGHQSGQQYFVQPTKEDILSALAAHRDLYVGPAVNHALYEKALSGEKNASEVADALVESFPVYDHLFAGMSDSDTYRWLREVGRYAPIVHLQQTDNKASAHKDFTEANNRSGCISGEKVITALYEAFRKPPDSDMPEPVSRIYMTLELFYSNTTKSYDIEKSIRASADYWRRFIPEDGIALDEAYRRIQTGVTG